MTTRTELTRSLEAKGISILHDDDHPMNGPSDYIMWGRVYNLISGLMNDDGMRVSPELLMGWHFSDTYLHISTVGAEFIIDNLAKYTTEQAAECVARFISGTYFMAALLPSLDMDEGHVRDYPYFN